jgi:hypothetical protein
MSLRKVAAGLDALACTARDAPPPSASSMTTATAAAGVAAPGAAKIADEAPLNTSNKIQGAGTHTARVAAVLAEVARSDFELEIYFVRTLIFFPTYISASTNKMHTFPNYHSLGSKK